MVTSLPVAWTVRTFCLPSQFIVPPVIDFGLAAPSFRRSTDHCVELTIGNPIHGILNMLNDRRGLQKMVLVFWSQFRRGSHGPEIMPDVIAVAIRKPNVIVGYTILPSSSTEYVAQFRRRIACSFSEQSPVLLAVEQLDRSVARCVAVARHVVRRFVHRSALPGFFEIVVPESAVTQSRMPRACALPCRILFRVVEQVGAMVSALISVSE